MYVLLTPARNEAEYLPTVIERVQSQVLSPEKWFIIDDGSTDRTPDIVDEYSNSVPWIEGVHLEREGKGYDTEFGYANVISAGIDHAERTIESEDVSEDVDVEYFGILDCDILIRDDYFHTLLSEMQSTPHCGISSGVLHTSRKRDDAEGEPRGGAMLFRRQCLTDVGGYPLTAAPDSVFRLKAKNRGWKTLKTAEACGKQLRPPQSARGEWAGYKRKAEGRYYLGYHPINSLLAGLYYCTQFPHYQGIAYLHGYFTMLLRDGAQTDDPEIRRHFREDRFEELIDKLKQRLGYRTRSDEATTSKSQDADTRVEYPSQE